MSYFDDEELLAEHNKEEHQDRYCIDCLVGRILPPIAPLNQLCGCGKAHVSHPAIILHLETGTCPNGMDLRQFVDVLDYDTAQTFIQVSNIPSPLTHHDIPRAFNGATWPCWMCHKTCGTKSGIAGTCAESGASEGGDVQVPGLWEGVAELSQHVDSKQCEVHENRRVMKKLGTLLRRLKGCGEEHDR